MRLSIPALLAFTTLASAMSGCQASAMPAAGAGPTLAAVVADPARTASAVARDAARHPVEELSFFGLAPSMTVVELWPGTGYWTEILGPYLAGRGHYIVALPARGDEEDQAVLKRWHERIAAQGSRLGAITETTLGKGQFNLAPAGTVDLIVTFRNLHNWMGSGYADQALAACFSALKPGGILGIEDHRGRTDRPQDPKAEDGYLREDYAIEMVKRAGFELVGRSEINANPKDTKDWVDGVWTLPPTLSQGDKDRARYLAIGEADNFVLKFRKPAR
jgi:predicted methyltransferase